MKNLVWCFVCVSCALTGCSVVGVGQVAHQVVSCTKSEDCKNRMAEECPKGGFIHSIRPSVTVEYSCS